MAKKNCYQPGHPSHRRQRGRRGVREGGRRGVREGGRGDRRGNKEEIQGGVNKVSSHNEEENHKKFKKGQRKNRLFREISSPFPSSKSRETRLNLVNARKGA